VRTLKAFKGIPYVDAVGCKCIDYRGKRKCIYHVVSGVYEGVRGVRSAIIKTLRSLERKHKYRYKFSVIYGVNEVVIYESKNWPYL
jgi:hypothetical protein